MAETISLEQFIGNRRVVDVLLKSIAQKRLPHAMIFGGPPGVGKCTLALILAQMLNCLSPDHPSACGACAACRKIGAILESRHGACARAKDNGPCGACAYCRLRMQGHPDVRLIEPEKTAIVIDQIRKLAGEVAFQPFEARCRLVVIDPADRMTLEAQNSLLKTLEEPPSRTVMILVTAHPYLLSDTIRSRARLLQFGPIPRDAIERHLLSRGGLAPEDARLAAALSGGSLETALAFNTAAYRETREQAFRFVALLLGGRGFTEASGLAAQIGKDKAAFPAWLDAVAALLEDTYYASVAPARVGQDDMMERLRELAAATPRPTLVSAIEAVRNLKGELQVNVNRPLALESMYLSLRRRP